MIKNIIALTAVGIFLIGAWAVLNPKEVPVGASSGPDFLSRAFFFDDAIVGGSVLATSSVGAATYTAAQVMNNKLIIHTAASALTVTLPASSTIKDIPRPGDTKTLFINPVTTLITFAGGTGTDLNSASTTKNINAGGLGRFDFVRKSNTDIEVLFTPGI